MTQRPYQPSLGKPNNSIWEIVGGVIAVVVIIAAASAAGILFNVGNTIPAPSPVTVITGINLQISYTGVDTGYLGPTSQATAYTYGIRVRHQFPFTIVLTSSAILLTHSINSITVETPGFTLDSVSPSLPYSLSPGASVVFTLILTAPNYNYDGPLTILVTTS